MSTKCTSPTASEGAFLDAFDAFRTNYVVSFIATIWLIDTIILLSLFPLVYLCMKCLSKRRESTGEGNGHGSADGGIRTHHVEPDLERGDGGAGSEKSTGRDSAETIVDVGSQTGGE